MHDRPDMDRRATPGSFAGRRNYPLDSVGGRSNSDSSSLLDETIPHRPMSPVKPLIAALVAALLFGLMVADREYTRSARLADMRAGRVIPFDSLEATRVRLTNPSGIYLLERAGPEEWRLVEPLAMRANATAVATLVDNIHTSRISSRFEEADGTNYGLDKPVATVELTAMLDGEKVERTLHLGAPSPRPGRVYGRIEGEDGVFTIGDWVRNQALRDLNDLRDRSLVASTAGSIESLAIETPGDSFTVERWKERPGEWRFAGTADPVNRDVVARAVNALTATPALRIDDQPTTAPAELGFERPLLRVRVGAGDQAEQLVVGTKAGASDQFYAWLPTQPAGAVAIVRDRSINDLLLPRQEWRTTRFFWEPVDTFARIEIDSGTRTTPLVRDPATRAWRFEDTPDLPVHPARLETFLKNLGAVAGQRLIAQNVSDEDLVTFYGFRPEMLSIRVTMADGHEHGLRLGPTVPNEMITRALRLQDRSVWALDVKVPSVISVGRGDLADKRLAHGWGDRLRRVVITANAGQGDRVVTLDRESGVWKLREPATPASIVPDREVAAFVFASEELSASAEVLAGPRDAVRDLRVEFLAGDGKPLHWVETFRSADGKNRLVRSPKATYEIEPESMKAWDSAMVAMIQMAREQAMIEAARANEVKR